LQINVALLAALGTLLLGIGQQSTWLPMIAILGATLSVCFTDILKWFRLNRNLANIAAVIAVVFSLSDFARHDSERQLLAVANLLVYLQIVLLFQEKNDRLYWQLLMLSLLQVTVSSALNLGFQFGILLAIYMFAAITAMVLFFIHRQRRRFGRRAGAAGRDAGEKVFTAAASGDPAVRMLGRTIAWRIFWMGTATLLITVVVFYALPRRSTAQWGTILLPDDATAFAEDVTLDEMRKLKQSHDPVLRISFFSQRSGEPYPVRERCYLRGSVLSKYAYEGGEGRWRRLVPRGPFYSSLGRAPAGTNLVRQEIVLEPTDNSTLFAVYPVYDIPQTNSDVRIERVNYQTYRNRISGGRFRYAVGTSGFEAGMQRSITPALHDLYKWDRKRLTDFPEEQLPQLKQIAEEALSDAGVSAGNPLYQARALEAHFRSSGLYTYSLDPIVERDPDLDPVEEFVAKHRTGHCEYYAAALVLMLRSQGIPAQMVVGYVAEDYNSVGGYFEVKEKDAHAWVEVYIAADEIPDDVKRTAPVGKHGIWLRLDPTPPSDEEAELAHEAGLIDRVFQLRDYMQTLWEEYVLRLDAQQQREAIFKPLGESLTTGLKNFFSPRAWLKFFRKLGRELASDRPSWRAAMVLFVLGLLAYLVHRTVQQMKAAAAPPALSRFAGWMRRRAGIDETQRARTVEFYRRLESLLGRYGMRRLVGQTQREFAAAVGGELADMPVCRSVASLPRRIAEAFYRVRFGHRSLDKDQSEEVEHALGNLERALSEDTAARKQRKKQ